MIGIFGGAFNPPHKEHIKMMVEALNEGLSKIVVVPSKNPPHKSTCQTPFANRVDMLNIALLGKKDIIIDNIEDRDDSIHYTYQTLPKLINKYGDVVFIMGGDSLIDFATWKNPQEIIKMCPIWVFKRGDRDEELEKAKEYWESKGANIKILSYVPKAISSSLIRYYLALGFDVDVDEKVLRYIQDNGLYQDYEPLIRKLTSYMTEKRFLHVLGVAKYALYLNDLHRLGLDQNKVLLAAILHDCAKRFEHDDSYNKDGVPLDAIGTPVEHQFLGAIVAKNDFKIDDEEILSAIRSHTTGKPNMTTLEKLIYCADLMEYGRKDDFLWPLRKSIEKDFEQGFLDAVKQQYDYLRSAKGDNIYPLTIDCAKYYLNI